MKDVTINKISNNPPPPPPPPNIPKENHCKICGKCGFREP
jgi:hypothetical protein